MPAKSKSQQILFSMALAVRRGKLKRSEVSTSVLDIVDSDMSNKEIEDFTVLKENNIYKMQPLYEYIMEAGFSIGAGFSEEQVMAQFGIIRTNNSEKNINDLSMLVGFLYNIWETDFESNPKLIPFRFGDRSVKIARPYLINKDDLFDFLDRKNVSYKVTKDGFSLGGIRFEWGDGSMFNNRAGKGLEYEDTVIRNMIYFIQVIAPYHKERKLSEADLKTIVEDQSLHNFFPLYTGGALNKVLDMYEDGVDLSTVITKTGSKGTQRNSKGQLFDRYFNITSSDIEDVLEESGNIIADVTIKSDPDVYISVKLKSAQLSGVYYQYALEKNEDMWNGIKAGKSFDDVKDEPDMKALINFCNVVGIDAEDVYEKYTCLVNNKKIDKDIKLSRRYDGRKLGILFQKLVGGNYWYVKPEKALFVPAKYDHWEFNVSNATIAPTGKRISIQGTIEGVPVELEFRTDGHGAWPYRLFPRTDVQKIINKLQ